MAVELWVFLARVSFCIAGIQGTCTAAPWIRSRKAAMPSTHPSSALVMRKCGSELTAPSLPISQA